MFESICSGMAGATLVEEQGRRAGGRSGSCRSTATPPSPSARGRSPVSSADSNDLAQRASVGSTEALTSLPARFGVVGPTHLGGFLGCSMPVLTVITIDSGMVSRLAIKWPADEPD